ncbi:MAG: lipocalin family protein [Bacteroidota bacterium]
MKYVSVPLILSLGLILCLSACTEDNQAEKEEQLVDSMVTQVLEQVGEDTLFKTPPPIVPELIGEWKVSKMSIGGTPLDQENNQYFTFQEDSRMLWRIVEEEDIPAETFIFTYEKNVIYTPFFPGKSARIKELNDKKMIFTIDAGDNEVDYELTKVD